MHSDIEWDVDKTPTPKKGLTHSEKKEWKKEKPERRVS